VEPWRIAVRAVFAYLVLLGLVRAAGKRAVHQGTAFDFVLSLVVGDLIDDVVWAEVAASRFTVAAGTLAMAHTAVALLCARVAWLDQVIGGRPVPVLRDGGMMRDGLREERMNEEDLAHAIRVNGLQRARWREIESAHVEKDGTVSVVRHPWAREATRADADAVRERT
jgi:uncharacterized membrane protein YcaP (DUF421 family)